MLHLTASNIREMFLGLTYAARFYILLLLVSGAYMICSLARTFLSLRRMAGDVAIAEAPRERSRLIKMAGRVEHFRQLNTLLFFLFGIFFANETLNTLRGIQMMSMSLSGARIDIFGPLAGFALFVFIVLAFLHTAQWAAAAQLQSMLNRINP